MRVMSSDWPGRTACSDQPERLSNLKEASRRSCNKDSEIGSARLRVAPLSDAIIGASSTRPYSKTLHPYGLNEERQRELL